MPRTDGATLRAWRRSRGWDVPETAARLRRAADQTGQAVAAHDALARMVYAWERGDHRVTERYELLYARALGVGADDLAAGAPAVPAGPTLLSVLVRERHWRVFRTFEAQFRRAARELAEREQEKEIAKVAVSERTFERWYAGNVRTMPRSDASRVLEHMFGYPVDVLLRPADVAVGEVAQGDPSVSLDHPVSGSLHGADEHRSGGGGAGVDQEGTPASEAEALEVMTWVTATNASDDAIAELIRSADYLADVHARLPAAKVLREVLGVHRAVQSLLRGGRQRLSQTRDLLRADSALLAHACLLLGDLGKYEAARAYGSAALLCAQEAGADEGLAWSAMAKTARWQDRFAEAAGLSARGFDASGNASVRAELAYREANAFALFGDVPRAREALAKAVRSSEGLDDCGVSAWSFSKGRQAIFTVSVCVHTGDPDGALRAVQEADAYWGAGGAKVAATWAQVRAGAAMAHLLKGSLDGADGQLAPVLEMPPDQRIRTVTGYLDEIGVMLRERRFAGSRLAARLGEQVREFNAVAVAASLGA